MAGKGRQAVRNQGGWPGWVWLCLGVLLGAVLATAVFMTGRAPNLRRGDVPVPNPHATAAKPSDPGIADEARTERSYDFYSVLPEKDVVIPDAELSARARAEGDSSAPGSSSPASGGGGGYLLQAGSFPNSADAEAVKARLALLGFVAHIEPVTINGNTWNRVRLGPYTSAATLEAAKDKLSAAGIKAIALKERD
ncbi:MAG TPA: SPOR domain-containing protein [Rhodanobacteraceae bacterium]|nr:SPOR domain-containing protein [Rhodanobacteraceae bacterium]